MCKLDRMSGLYIFALKWTPKVIYLPVFAMKSEVMSAPIACICW